MAASELQCWTTFDLITWIQSNLPKQYHSCITAIKEHDIDGELLKQCLDDQDAKSNLLQMLFPDSKNGAFLRLSFIRKIEKFDQDKKSQENKTDNNELEPHAHASDDDNICVHCGATIASLLIANHQRHCHKQSLSQALSPDTHNEQTQDEITVHMNHIEEHTTICCTFCEIEFKISLIDEHEIYCGSRTDLCHNCGLRDTLFRFKHHQHKCRTNDDNNITFNDSPLNINNNSNDLWISSFERHLYDLEKILHDRFIVDYNKTSAHFEQYDSFGNKKKQVYQQKKNQNISKIRTHHISTDDVSNEARHKFEKVDVYDGKSKDELRKIYEEKFKMSLNLLKKILENIIDEPLNEKYRILRCSNKKLKSIIFSYSPCCEFLKLCDFVYILEDGCYKLTDANHAKLKIAIGVIKYVLTTFEQKATKQDYEQNKWEFNQAYVRNDKSIFHGSWSCKKCNHLNRKTSTCKKCKTKKKHSLRKEQKERNEIKLSVKRWICGHCGNRNAVELKQCDNCKQTKTVAKKQMKQYHQKAAQIQTDPQHANDANQDKDEDDLYLHHDEWM